MDLLTFGQRLRHFRRNQDLTLDELGGMVGKPASYLSTVETGRREPKVGLVDELARALGIEPAVLLEPTPPSRRAELEILLERYQAESAYQALGLPHLKAGVRMPDAALEHLARLYRELRDRNRIQAATPREALEANRSLRDHLESNDMYFAAIEAEASKALAAVAFDGSGTVPETTLNDLVAHFGFEVQHVSELPSSLRSLTDLRSNRILIRQRDELRTRRARTVILQTLGHFVLDHGAPTSYSEFLQQRMEANYFAAAVLAPESSAVLFLQTAKAEKRLSIEDLKEIYYINYRLAAQRFTNLATLHLGIRSHFLRSDEQGVVWRAYGNSRVPFPLGPDGSLEGQLLCRQWGTRAAFHSEDKFRIHYQYTDTEVGTFWCSTHIEVDREPVQAITVGVRFEDARFFRGSDTDRRSVSRCPDGECCRRPPADLAERWAGFSWPSARADTLNPLGVPSGVLPGVDITEVYEYLDALDGG